MASPPLIVPSQLSFSSELDIAESELGASNIIWTLTNREPGSPGSNEQNGSSQPSSPSQLSFSTLIGSSRTKTTDDPVPTGVFKDDKYYLDMVIFLVEDRSFMVPKYHFSKTTDFFNPMFQEEESVVRLDGIYKADFRALLKLFCPLYLENPTLSQDEWASVLQLATKWTMIDIRQMAIDHLPSETMSPVDRLSLAQSCSVYEWMRPACVQLVERVDSISIEEAEKLGVDVALRLCWVRERRFRALLHGLQAREIVSPTKSLSNVIDSLFAMELQEGLATPDLIERIMQARNYGMVEWLRSSFVDLAERPDSISFEEAARLGFDTAFHVCDARIQYLRSLQQMAVTYGVHCEIVDSLGIINDEFKNELREVEIKSHDYRQAFVTLAAIADSEDDGTSRPEENETETLISQVQRKGGKVGKVGKVKKKKRSV